MVSTIASPICFPIRSPSAYPCSNACFSTSMTWSCAVTPAAAGIPLVMLTRDACRRPSPRMILDDILVRATTRTKRDDAFLFQLPDDFDDSRLGGVYVLD